ncbi:uncharacterized protein LOC6582389 [Drosophila mojavensis]|uniref:Uncharacterized protein n=1 Tax=Drosophila mojavensis TaxID=7230 RepID=B4KWU7_DROMO|nr:uncharacterized protein LOC6582389 [Drosophila mojavensis]EDW18568.1 uncharacterized protein Dmoj_GI12016 [Drosophila mojavensis]
MLKKFVEVNADESPSVNPYAVRTYMGDNVTTEWKVENCPPRDRVCMKKPPNSTISHVLTIEDELRRLHQKAEESRFARPYKKSCDLYDEFTMCIIPQRLPGELKTNAEMRERILLSKTDAGLVEHDARLSKSCPKDLVVLNSPMNLNEEEEEEDAGEEEETEVKPQKATPECSSSMIIIPDKRMLELKRPKSRIYLNETQVGPLEELPFPTYDPRVIQESLEGENLRSYDIIEGCNPQDLWTWNVGLQKREIEMDQDFITASLPKYGHDVGLTVYNIPTQLEKTFTAEIVFGNRNIYPEPKKEPHRSNFYNRPSEVACIIVAFVETYQVNPDFWTAGTMDGILKRGVKLTKKSISLNYKSEDTDFDILPQVMERQAAVKIKIHFTGLFKNEPNLYKALSLYFSKYNACIFVSRDMFMLIWKRCVDSFFIFDPNGRNELCQRDFEDGMCSLMATRFMEHLVHLITQFSDLTGEDEFSIYEIALSQYGKLKEPIIGKSKAQPFHKLWAVVNENFAVKTGGNSGIQQPISGKEKNASLVVSLIALIYSEFELAKVWRPMTIDDIIRYGVAYYKTLRKKFRLDGKRWKNKKPELNVVDLPEMFLMGAFKATVRKKPFLITGHVTDCKTYLESQLTHALYNLFKMPEWPAALLQIDNSVLGVWRDREFFYAFDPFRRNRVGMVVDPDDYRIKGLAVLQMHTTFDSFVRIIYQNALKMRRGGKFFIHGIRTGCIRPLQVMTQESNKFPAMQMGLPTFTDEPGEAPLAQKQSIESIPEEERFPTKEEREFAEELILEIINSIIKEIPEQRLERPYMYRQAQKVLLASDKENLRALRLKIKRGYELEEEEPVDLKRVLTIEEELELKSNYQTLHDGAYIIMGTTKLPQLDPEMTKLGGVLAALVATAVSAKYKVSTWNAELVEFCIYSVNKFGEEYQNYELILACLLNKKLPDIAVGESNFSLVVSEVYKSSVSSSLRQDLLELLIDNNRVLVVCQHFSCVIFKRYNLLYMFIGFPCNAVGYRKGGAGPACMMRFIELDSLIRRIEFGCNPQGCSVMNYIVAAIKIVDNNIKGHFRRWNKADEDAEYNAELARKNKMQEQRLEKMRVIDEELRKENKRIQDYLTAKQAHEDRKKGKKPEYKDLGIDEGVDEEQLELMEMDEEEEGEGEEEVELKHKPGKHLPKEVRKAYKPRPILYGYRMREKDCNFKIQGSMNLEGRADGSFKEIKPCYFASALAILSVSLRPLNRWNSYRIDRVITHAKSIATRVCDLESVFERVVRHVTIDEYEFDIWIRILEPLGMWTPAPKPVTLSPDAALVTIKKKMQKLLNTRKYLMIFTPNGCFALYHDEFYHLFDPYASMDKPGEEEEEEAADAGGEEGDKKKKKKCPKGPKRYPERNTASWVLFADVESMFKYIDKRSSQPDWKERNQYMFYVVDVLSYKKAAPNARILQLLTDLSIPMTCSNRQYGRPEYEICATNESLGWLELENCLPVWSRMNRRNTAGKYRNLPLSKLKKYDVEIEGRLWSLWGNLHPEAPVFEDSLRGRQYLAIYVVACCAASVYNLMDWSAQLLDTIVVSGNKYFQESIAQITQEDYEFSLENLNIDCSLETINFVVHIEHVCYGKLYRVPTFNRMNLSEALIYFFSHYQFGVVMVRKRALAIGFCPGHDGGYFMYDCQEKDQPLFPKQQGASYLLRTRHLQVLLYCIVVTLNVPFYNIDFSIHKVEMLREGATVENEEEEEEGDQ